MAMFNQILRMYKGSLKFIFTKNKKPFLKRKG